MPSTWNVQPADAPRADALAHTLGLHPVTAQLLLNRGVLDARQAAGFLQPSVERMADSGRLPDLDRAVERLQRAVRRREPMLLFTDSDVDGLTAGAMLFEALTRLGGRIQARPSNRITEGYGLPAALVASLRRSAVKLLILVDCGTNQASDVRQLAAHGIDTVIVDHHVPLEDWAQPYALVNPHREATGGRELCSAGIAFKLIQALLQGRTDDVPSDYLDLAALGTLADCSPLLGDSRTLVAEGLRHLLHTRRPGLARLCELAGLRQADPVQVLRRLTPKLNASGRLGDAASVWRLLLREGGADLEASLAQAERAHETTKQMHRQVMAEADAQLSRLHFRDQYVLVVSRPGWHQGLMGPLAAQLAQRYHRPAIAIAMAQQQGTGSGRSVPHFNLLDALRACQPLLMRFGGHAQACGLTVDRAQLEPFRELVNEQAKRSLGPQGLIPSRSVDLELPLSAIARRWVQEAEQLAPFGQGNPRPTVAIRRVTFEVRSPRVAVCSDGRTELAAKGSFAGVVSGERYDVVATPTLAGDVVTLTVSDVRGAAAPSRPARTSGTPCTPASV